MQTAPVWSPTLIVRASGAEPRLWPNWAITTPRPGGGFAVAWVGQINRGRADVWASLIDGTGARISADIRVADRGIERATSPIGAYRTRNDTVIYVRDGAGVDAYRLDAARSISGPESVLSRDNRWSFDRVELIDRGDVGAELRFFDALGQRLGRTRLLSLGPDGLPRGEPRELGPAPTLVSPDIVDSEGALILTWTHAARDDLDTNRVRWTRTSWTAPESVRFDEVLQRRQAVTRGPAIELFGQLHVEVSSPEGSFLHPLEGRGDPILVSAQPTAWPRVVTLPDATVAVTTNGHPDGRGGLALALSPTGPEGETVVLGETSCRWRWFDAARDDDGNLLVAWIDSCGAGPSLRARVRRPGRCE